MAFKTITYPVYEKDAYGVVHLLCVESVEVDVKYL